MLQDARLRAPGPFVGAGAGVFAVQAYLNLGTPEAMRFRIMWMKDETDRDKVDLVDGGSVEDIGPVEAVLQAVYMSRDVRSSGQTAFVEAYLVEMKALLRDVGIV